MIRRLRQKKLRKVRKFRISCRSCVYLEREKPVVGIRKFTVENWFSSRRDLVSSSTLT